MGSSSAVFILLSMSARPWGHRGSLLQALQGWHPASCMQRGCLLPPAPMSGVPPCMGELGWLLKAARGHHSCLGMMIKAAVPREGWAAGTSWCEQMASCCVTCHRWALPRRCSSSKPRTQPQPALCLAQHSCSWQGQRVGQRSRQVGAGLCWHIHSLFCARARQE